METRAIAVDGHIFRLQLEGNFWDCLDEIVEHHEISIHRLVSSCWSRHPDDIASNLRVFVLEHYQQRASSDAEAAVGSVFSKH